MFDELFEKTKNINEGINPDDKDDDATKIKKLLEDEKVNEREDVSEITDIIYDALMQNVGEPYVKFDLEKVENQEVISRDGLINFEYDGVPITLEVHIGNSSEENLEQ